MSPLIRYMPHDAFTDRDEQKTQRFILDNCPRCGGHGTTQSVRSSSDPLVKCSQCFGLGFINVLTVH